MHRLRSHVRLLVSLISFLYACTKAENSSEPSFKKALHDLLQKVQQRKVFGNKNDPIMLTELPGYTGWHRQRNESNVDTCVLNLVDNRPFTHGNIVHHLDISSSKSSNRTYTWTLSIACPNITDGTTNPTGGKIPMPLFYARAYGPAILAGSQKNAGWNATASNNISKKQAEIYSLTEISFTFKDPGMYTVEIVLESLFTPNIYTLPHTTDHHPYYGFLIPGFPLILNVTSSSHGPCNTAQTCNVSLCTSQDIQSDVDSSTGRWIVLGHTSRIIDKPFVLIEDTKIQDKGFRSYAEGPNRLSIEMDYQPMNCVLAPLKSSMTLLDACMRDVGGVHFILLGDSVTRLHVGALKQLLHPRHQVTLVSLRGSITNTIDAASKQLLELRNDNSTQPKVIVINAGIWELEKFCLNGGAANFRAESNISNDDVESCGVYYRQNIQRVLDLIVKTFPSELKIFRPTQAAFMKWGNFGFSWSPVHMQNIVQSPHVVKMFNDIAFQAIRESGYDVKIYDFFWMTWSRPDDTQIDKDNNAGKHMGHMGHDTLKVSLRKMFTLVADHFGCFRI